MKAVKYAGIRIIIHIYEWRFMKPRYYHGFYIAENISELLI